MVPRQHVGQGSREPDDGEGQEWLIFSPGVEGASWGLRAQRARAQPGVTRYDPETGERCMRGH